MSKYEHPCPTPSTFLRREGTVWVCDCEKLWRIVIDYSLGGGISKDWKEIKIIARGQK